VHVGGEQRQQPLKTPIGEVLSMSYGRAFGATVGLARSHGCEVVVALQAAESERVQPLLREFLTSFLSGCLDIGDHFTHGDRRYTSQVMDIQGLGPGHGALDAFLVAMEPLKRVIELIPVVDVLDQDGIERSFVLRAVQAECCEGMHQARLVGEAEPWRAAVAYQGAERRKDAPSFAWYSALPGYRRVDRGATWHAAGTDGVTLHLFGRDLMAVSSPYSSGLGHLTGYEELVLIGTRPDGERAFIARAIHLAGSPSEAVLDELDVHDHQWISTFLERRNSALAPRVAVAAHTAWPQAGDGVVQMLRVIAVEAREEFQSAATLRGVVEALQARIQGDTGSALAVTTVELREIAGTLMLGARLQASDRQWIERGLDALGAIAGAAVDLNYMERDAGVVYCRRHPAVFVLPAPGQGRR